MGSKNVLRFFTIDEGLGIVIIMLKIFRYAHHIPVIQLRLVDVVDPCGYFTTLHILVYERYCI